MILILCNRATEFSKYIIGAGMSGRGRDQESILPEPGRSGFGAGRTCAEKGPPLFALGKPFGDAAAAGPTGSEPALGA